MPVLILQTYALASALTFVVYGLDKRAAQRGGWRVSEATLHFLSLVGGWPGALAAQRAFRHKTQKRPFRAVFWVTVAVNVALFGGLSASSALA